ncbi:DNA polymerase eta [Mycena kentingensis (nom. inval.)]|nr:DNA polymerase eta [Mycena kentingensis (nom. inval.)]
MSNASSFWKAKSNATHRVYAHAQSQYTDLDPQITYRTILSPNLGVKDPLRVIALCDSDAFYAACEMVRLGIDKPLVVLQWQLIIAVNYPARKFGVARMMPLAEAKERCPELVVIHVMTYKDGVAEPRYWENPDTRTHKVCLDLYRRESAKMIQMFKTGLPENVEVEKASIDEAFMDLTPAVRQILLHRYPHLGQVPADAPLGPDTPLPLPKDIPWHAHSTIIPAEPPTADEDMNAEAGAAQKAVTWHDVALSIGGELMHKGIARNKFLAKLCASHRKPMGQSILPNASIPNHLLPMKFQKIRFLGGKLGVALADEYDVATVSDFLSISLETMQHRFGEESIWVYEALRGIDYSEVKEKQLLSKSMLSAKQFPQPVTTQADALQWIRVLSSELSLRLIDAREMAPTMWPKTLAMHTHNLASGDGRKSKQAAWPFVREVTADVIFTAAEKLWRELVDPNGPIRVTGILLSFKGIGTVEAGLKPIDEIFKRPTSKRGAPASESEDIIAADNATSSEETRTVRNISKERSTFVCSRCGHRASLVPSATRTDFEREEEVMQLQMEHDDFHVALDLSRVSENEVVSRREGKGKGRKQETGEEGQQPRKKKRGQAEEPKGIAKFFTRKGL